MIRVRLRRWPEGEVSPAPCFPAKPAAAEEKGRGVHSMHLVQLERMKNRLPTQTLRSGDPVASIRHAHAWIYTHLRAHADRTQISHLERFPVYSRWGMIKCKIYVRKLPVHKREGTRTRRQKKEVLPWSSSKLRQRIFPVTQKSNKCKDLYIKQA